MFFLFLFLATPAVAEDLIFYVVDANLVVKAQIDTVKSYGKKNDLLQPFRNTYSLLATNTNYVLLAFTPQNPTEQNVLTNLIDANKVGIYQVYKFENERMWLDQDFSGKYDLNTDWVAESSSTGTRTTPK